MSTWAQSIGSGTLLSFCPTRRDNCVNILLGFGEKLDKRRRKIKLPCEVTFITTRTVFAEFSCTSVLEQVTSLGSSNY